MTDGLLVEVLTMTLGSATTASAAAGATSVPVEDLTDFDETGGRVEIAGTVYDYTGVDEDADLLLLAQPLAAAVAEHEPVLVMVGGEPGVDYYAVVDLGSDDGDLTWVPLRTREERLAWPVKVYEPPLPVTLADDLTAILEAPGVTPQIDGGLIDPATLPSAGGGPGQTFSSSAPSSTTGFTEGHAWWQVVDGEVVGFWRLASGAWVQQQIVTSAAIESLSTINLTALNANVANLSGGSIYIAQGVAASINEAFSGTSLPTGWTSTKVGPFGTGSAGANLPGVSVVSSGPTGQVGSALLVDYGAPGITDHSADGSGEVYSTLADSNAAEIEVRFRATAPFNPFFREGDSAMLAVRSSDGAAFSGTWDAVTLELIGGTEALGATYYQVSTWVNGVESSLGFIYVTTDPSTAWHRAKLRVTGEQVSAKVWQDGATEPAWTTFQNTSGGAPGRASLVWRQSTDNTRGQDLWVDEFNVTTFQTGFQVNSDGTGEWPGQDLSASMTDSGDLLATSPFTGSMRFIRFGKVVWATGAITRASSFSSSYTNTGVTVPAGMRPAATMPAGPVESFVSTLRYQFQVLSTGEVQLRQSETTGGEMRLTMHWLID